MTPRFIELRALAVGAPFMFFADDLDHRGPCTLVSKGPGCATIKYEPHTVVKKFKSRDRKTGEFVEREISTTLSGLSSCALGAQVIPL